MATIVRKCAACGQPDRRERWGSLEKAAAAGATEASWACPKCSWPEFDLVELEEDEDPHVTRGAAPDASGDPDEARRRAAPPMIPFR